jgi:hypothetical protein
VKRRATIATPKANALAGCAMSSAASAKRGPSGGGGKEGGEEEEKGRKAGARGEQQTT